MVERVIEAKEFSPKNTEFILNFKDYLISEGIGKAKIIRYLGEMFKLNRLVKKD